MDTSLDKNSAIFSKRLTNKSASQMIDQKQVFIHFTILLILLITSFSAFADELNADETKETRTVISSESAKKYLNDMHLTEAELVEKYSHFRSTIMMRAADGLIKMLPTWIAQQAKRNGTQPDQLTIEKMLSISTKSLGILAQQLTLTQVADCHFKESRNLDAAAKGEALGLVDCRASVYKEDRDGDFSSSTTKDAETVAYLISKWILLNMLYSKAAACDSGYCF